MNIVFRKFVVSFLCCVWLLVWAMSAAHGQYWQEASDSTASVAKSVRPRTGSGRRSEEIALKLSPANAQIHRFPVASAKEWASHQPETFSTINVDSILVAEGKRDQTEPAEDNPEGNRQSNDDSDDDTESDDGEPASPSPEDAEVDWNLLNLNPSSIGKRLFPFEVSKDEKLSPITRVDLSEPLVAPHADYRTGHVPFQPGDFTPMPDYSLYGYDGELEKSPYYGKYINPTERPWVELGRGMYLAGLIPPSQTWLGQTNLVAPHFLVYGDFRTAVAYNDNGTDELINAYRLNLDLDLKITATERIHAFIGPLDRGADFTRVVVNNGDVDFVDEFDDNFDNVFFEGDLGAMLGGFTGMYPPFDLPVAAGIMPMLFQNGTWMLDNFLGAAVTLPAKHSRRLNWSNFDVTFFTAFDLLNSPAFPNDDSQAQAYGVHTFIEAYQGYLEVGYAFLDDQLGQGLSYHNIGISFSRRYLQRISNSIRFIANTGQDPVTGAQTADGHLVLLEYALITPDYTRVVPYLNLFAGFDRPQSVARAGGVGGVLLNTGINFETDGLTGFPRLDDTANDTFGGAVGLNLIGPDLAWQVITEFAVVQAHGNDDTRNIPDDQYGFGVRYQRPITNAWLVRADAMYGIREKLDDISGTRIELRYKF